MGMTTSPTGHGYRLVARDGGIFSFGKIAFAGSLPGRHIHVSDVIGMASTPSGNGYWIARSNGQVAAFGDAPPLGNGTASACDRFTAIIGNPNAVGYRLVKDSGRSVGFGDAPGGVAPVGPQRQCGHVTARIELASTTVGARLRGRPATSSSTTRPVARCGSSSHGCKPKWAVTIANDAIPNAPLFTTECTRKPLVIAAGREPAPVHRASELRRLARAVRRRVARAAGRAVRGEVRPVRPGRRHPAGCAGAGHGGRAGVSREPFAIDVALAMIAGHRPACAGR